MLIVATVLQGLWLNSILEHFDKSLSLLASIAIVFVIGVLTPKALNGFLLLALFVTQCYIWIF